MRYTHRNEDDKDPDKALFSCLQPLVNGLGISLVELNVFHSKGRGGKTGSVQVRAIVFKNGNIGVDDCTMVHRTIMPRLDISYPGQNVYLEVSSPGINRIIKDGREFVHYIGQELNCYRTDITDWTAGTLVSADEKGIKLLSKDGEISLPYEDIAKARLNGSVP